MDHIEPPYGTEHRLKIPFVSNRRFTFDGGDFLTYPVRCGILPPEKLSSGSILQGVRTEDLFPEGRSIDELAPFLQAWLFFGTLHHVFKTLINSDFQWTHFVEKDADGQMFITTKYLPCYILNWAAFESSVAEDFVYGPANIAVLLHSLEVVIMHIVTIYFHKGKLKSSLVDQDTSEVSLKSPGHLVLLSIMMLYEALHAAATLIYQHFPGDPFPGHLSNFPPLLKELLEIAGWCAFEIEALEQFPDIRCTSAYFLSMIDRRGLQKDHSSCSLAGKCRAYDVDYDVYVTKHVTPNCKCRFLPPDNSNVPLCVSWILDDGGIPLLTVHDNEDGVQPYLTVTYSSMNEKEKIPPYVAISHVWSDGLGNLQRDALPLCILRKIQNLVNDLFEPSQRPVYFWIDTICVPTKNKLPALEAMLHTYKNAELVLVLDASLEACSVRARPQERLLRITISPWMRRLWTLQEAWVAKRLAFQFSEKACLTLDLTKACTQMPNRMKLDPKSFTRQIEWKSSPCYKFANQISRALGVDSESGGPKAPDMEVLKFHLMMDQVKRQYEDNKPFLNQIFIKRLWSTCRNLCRIGPKTVSLKAESPRAARRSQKVPDQQANRNTVPSYPRPHDRRLARFIRQSHMLDLTFDHASSRLYRLTDKTHRERSSYPAEVGDVFKALQLRTTSRKEDEAYCIANLTKVPVLPILLAEPQHRMEKLISSMNVVPSSIIFSFKKTRLGGDRFSWAPASFMQDKTVLHVENELYGENLSIAHIKDRELHVSLPGFKIFNPECDPDDKTASCGTATEGFVGSRFMNIWVKFTDPEDKWSYELFLSGEGEHPITSWKEWDGLNLKVIVRNKFDPPKKHMYNDDVIDGALVSEVETGADASVVKYHTSLFVKRSSPLREGRNLQYHGAEWVENGHLWRIV